MMTYRRKRTAGVNKSYRPQKRRRTTSNRSRGLVPQYQGFVPRMFSLGEWKYLDTDVGNAVNTTGAYSLINGLTLGNTANSRVGQKISIRSIELRYYGFVTAGTGVDQIHRMSIIVDRQANGVTPTVGSHLTSNTPVGLRDLAYRSRYKTLFDRVWTMNASGEPGSFRNMHVYLKFRRPIVVEYNTGNAGTVADITTNAIYFYRVGTQAAGGTAGSSNSTCRIRFTDM